MIEECETQWAHILKALMGCTNMVGYKIQQGSPGGRFGEAIGKSLAENVPREVERYRLASGLKQFEQEAHNLTPLQQGARISAIPGITPQMTESLLNLARTEGLRNAYSRNAQGPRLPIRKGSQPEISENRQRFLPQETGKPIQPLNEKNVSNQINLNPKTEKAFENQILANQGLGVENPIQQKFLPAIPFTPEEKDVLRDEIWSRNPYLSPEQLEQRVNDEEQRYLAAPQAYREQQEYLKTKETEAENLLNKNLEQILQKEGKEIFGDLTGETLIDLRQQMLKDLGTNPKLSAKQAAEKWAKIGKDFTEAKTIISTLSNRDIFDKVIPYKKEESLKRLISAQPIYQEMGRQKEFYNQLISDFDLSPQKAALIAYPISNNLKNVLNKTYFGDLPFKDLPIASKNLASEFLKNRTAQDSILSFAQEAKDNVRFFDEKSFFDYLRDHQDELTSDQQKELLRGVSDFLPNWGDVALFPYIGQSKANYKNRGKK